MLEGRCSLSLFIHFVDMSGFETVRFLFNLRLVIGPYAVLPSCALCIEPKRTIFFSGRRIPEKTRLNETGCGFLVCFRTMLPDLPLISSLCPNSAPSIAILVTTRLAHHILFALGFLSFPITQFLQPSFDPVDCARGFDR